MARKKKHEDHVNHEAWAIPYGDLITLLLAFFVVMYSISSVNEGKYRVLSESMVAAFHGSPRSTRPIQIGDSRPSGTTDQGSNVAHPLGVADPTTIRLPQNLDEISAQAQDEPGLSVDAQGMSESGLRAMAQEVRAALGDLIEMDQVRVRESEFWLEIEVQTDILFPTGVADVSSRAVPVLARLARVLAPFPNPVRVEGHTDDVPISTGRFPSNWELSAARAANVVRLFAGNDVDPARLAAIGMGEYQPVAENSTIDGRNRNRRVLVVVLANDLTRLGAERARQTDVNQEGGNAGPVEAGLDNSGSPRNSEPNNGSGVQP